MRRDEAVLELLGGDPAAEPWIVPISSRWRMASTLRLRALRRISRYGMSQIPQMRYHAVTNPQAVITSAADATVIAASDAPASARRRSRMMRWAEPA
jgi:hypothetical protein